MGRGRHHCGCGGGGRKCRAAPPPPPRPPPARRGGERCEAAAGSLPPAPAPAPAPAGTPLYRLPPAPSHGLQPEGRAALLHLPEHLPGPGELRLRALLLPPVHHRALGAPGAPGHPRLPRVSPNLRRTHPGPQPQAGQHRGALQRLPLGRHPGRPAQPLPLQGPREGQALLPHRPRRRLLLLRRTRHARAAPGHQRGRCFRGAAAGAEGAAPGAAGERARPHRSPAPPQTAAGRDQVLSQEPAGDYRGGFRAAAPAAAGAAEGDAGGAGGGHGADADRHRAEDPTLQPAAPQGAGGQPDPPGALGRSRQTRLFSRRRFSFREAEGEDPRDQPDLRGLSHLQIHGAAAVHHLEIPFPGYPSRAGSPDAGPRHCSPPPDPLRRLHHRGVRQPAPPAAAGLPQTLRRGGLGLGFGGVRRRGPLLGGGGLREDPVDDRFGPRSRHPQG
ncbi:uncharacterized protein LOC142418571 isoform X2 [Mycteria americana]|uniref:uncharacterized protein LOC142418571 isoform X2 n=1 Tax=Mycteria americana TaxID=33587 RepID=UPI003F582C24